jgi:NitT/TauT family transport system ATP-binding protein
MLLTLPLAPTRQPPSESGEKRAILLTANAVERSYTSTNGAPSTMALASTSLRVWDGEFICIVGPSGCGKTTLLRILGGLLDANAGQVWLKGEEITAPRREVGYVFQHANLMPWRTVLNNVTLPLELQGRPREEREARAMAVLALVGLEGFENAYPRQLSGGMAQRTALARTLIHEPELLLLDEPFGALDAMTRERMNLELIRIREAYEYTAIMVTHSIQEAVFLADRVLVMSQRPGRVVTEIPIPLPRPRTIDLLGTAQFGSLAQEVRHAIDQQRES